MSGDPSWLDVTQAVFSTGATVTGLIFAYRGFQSWRREMRGRSEFEVARRLLQSTMKIRDAIGHVRNPFMVSGEWAGRPTVTGESQEKTNLNNEIHAYNKRLERLDEACREFYVARLEGEVLWGKEAFDVCDDITKARAVLLANLNGWFMTKNRNIGRGEAAERVDHYEKIIYGLGEPDEFKNSVDAAVKKVDGFARPHLK